MQIPAITNGLSGLSGLSGVANGPGGVGGVGGVGSVSSPAAGSGGGFGSMLTDAISSLNDSQNTAASDSVALATGQASDVTSVVTDVEKANLEMQLAVQVRNKAVDAYEELMRMQI
jgi:flagellar hook-basal body complex protein FliE